MQQNRRAVSGYAFLIDGGAISWNSKQQEIVSLSTTESEYVTATHATKEAIWLRSLISQVFVPSPSQPLYFQTTSPLSHSRRTISTIHILNTLTSISISSAGLSKKEFFDSSFVWLLTWLPIALLRHCPPRRSSILRQNLACTRLEGECWNSTPYEQALVQHFGLDTRSLDHRHMFIIFAMTL